MSLSSEMPSVEQHRNEAPLGVKCMVVTVSDTRTPETDRSGALMKALLEESGYEVVRYDIVADEYDQIRSMIAEAAHDETVEAILFNGGTGISPRDTTYEAVRDSLDKEMSGFGELFRYLSFEEIGAAAMLSRATAGVVGTTAVFATPGSSGAVKLAMTRLIIPELRHVVREITKHS